jgi:23S rRNA (guanosine2251-2'-O)-methyltransferase
MLVYGKNVLKDIDSKKIRKVYLNENFHNKEIIDYLSTNNIHYFLVSKQQLDRMVDGNHQGVVIDMDEYQYYTLNYINNEEFVIALDHLEDVHNFGAIIRSAEAAGVKSIIIPKDRSVRVNDIVMKTSCGAIDRVKIILVNNIVDALKKLQKENYFVYSSFMDGDDYKKVDYSGKKILVIGNEGKGISKVVENITDFRIGIPMSGKVNSLNASVAAGILIFAMK